MSEPTNGNLKPSLGVVDNCSSEAVTVTAVTWDGFRRNFTYFERFFADVRAGKYDHILRKGEK